MKDVALRNIFLLDIHNATGNITGLLLHPPSLCNWKDAIYQKKLLDRFDHVTCGNRVLFTPPWSRLLNAFQQKQKMFSIFLKILLGREVWQLFHFISCCILSQHLILMIYSLSCNIIPTVYCAGRPSAAKSPLTPYPPSQFQGWFWFQSTSLHFDSQRTGSQQRKTHCWVSPEEACKGMPVQRHLVFVFLRKQRGIQTRKIDCTGVSSEGASECATQHQVTFRYYGSFMSYKTVYFKYKQ